MHQMTDNNNLCHHTTTQIGDVVSRLEKMLERMEGKMVARQEKMETQLRELKTGQETQVKELKTALEKSEERMEGKMVAGQEKMETQLRELKTGQESINRIAIAFTVAAVVLQGDFIKPLLASFFKQLL
jgi:flagellar hook-basal body complex protein FliE